MWGGPGVVLVVAHHLLSHVADQPLIKVHTPQVRVPCRCHHLRNALINAHQGRTTHASSQVQQQHVVLVLGCQPVVLEQHVVRHSGSTWLVHAALHLQARQLGSVSQRLALVPAEACRHREHDLDGVVRVGAQCGHRVPLELTHHLANHLLN
mmetsp:Transcript_30445/g.67541  ORF Transcript_30445/g.67541 Transcript_30445/m.67541 type:complete len:152 (+) Transcript_30445:775-1230(+)